MHRRPQEYKYWFPPERPVPPNAGLGCVTEGPYSGPSTGSLQGRPALLSGTGSSPGSPRDPRL